MEFVFLVAEWIPVVLVLNMIFRACERKSRRGGEAAFP
jgi:hypothetical protein